MKIKIIEIEASAEEIRTNKTLAESIAECGRILGENLASVFGGLTTNGIYIDENIPVDEAEDEEEE